jgi:hypothetical protein
MSAQHARSPQDGDESGAGSGVDRRGLMKNAGRIGAAGIAAGVVFGAGTATAAAAEPAAVKTEPDPRAVEEAATPQEPLMVRVSDAARGELDFFHGEQHHRVVDRELVRALLRHAR